MAGIAVSPAAVANGIANNIPMNEIKLGGPSLLFVTLLDVFASMGSLGPIFGVIFYLLVLIAAITSAISLIEVITTFILDRASQNNKKGNRNKVVLIVCLAIMIEAALVAVDGLGSNGVPVPFKEATATILADGTVQYAGWNDCWLDFMDMLSEGIAMPLGALLMSIMIGWEIHPKTVLDEIHLGASNKIDGFFCLCIKIIAPLGMLLVLSGQIASFFGQSAEKWGYIFGIVISIIGFFAAYTSPKRKENAQ